MIECVVIAATLCLGLVSCAPRRQAAPANAGLHHYTEALRASDPRPMYLMLSQEQRKAWSYPQWVQKWKATAEEREEQAQQISRKPGTASVSAVADVTYPDGQKLRLVETLNGWRLGRALLSDNFAATPARALARLRDALSRRDTKALLLLLTNERRSAIERRLEGFERALAEQQETAPSELYQVSDKRAELSWAFDDVGFHLVFLLEEGTWRLDQVRLGPTLGEKGTGPANANRADND